MKPKEILLQWINAFNNCDPETISALYDDNAVNHQVADDPVIGRTAIKQMFENEFSQAEMIVLSKIYLKTVNGSFLNGKILWV